MKDKHGHDLPNIKEEVSGTTPDDAYVGMRCHGCQKQVPGGKVWTMRLYGMNTGKPIVQGPLCPHCSELPPEHLPSRNLNERWW